MELQKCIRNMGVIHVTVSMEMCSRVDLLKSRHSKDSVCWASEISGSRFMLSVLLDADPRAGNVKGSVTELTVSVIVTFVSMPELGKQVTMFQKMTSIFDGHCLLWSARKCCANTRVV